MHGLRIPSVFVAVAYLLLYGALWPVGIIRFAWLIHDTKATSVPGIVSVLAFTIIALGCLTWGVSLVTLFIKHADAAVAPVLPPRFYIMPFVYAWVWLMGTWGVFWAKRLAEVIS